MGAIAIAVRKSTYDGADWKQQMAFRACWVNVGLKENPPTMKNPGNVVYYIAYTEKLTVKELAYMGCLAAHIGEIPAGYEVPLRDPTGAQTWSNVDWQAMRPQIKTFCDDKGVVLPGDPGWSADSYQDILDLQGAPGWLLASDRIPETWSQ